jgi:NMD protein affecting ribosome stability and mRNA decay
MKLRSQSERVWPARWSPFAVEPIHERYRQPDKAPTASCCPVCGAVFLKGRWQWRNRPPGANTLLCTACQRAADHAPAARIRLSGEFEAAHREDILTLARHREAALRADHPMERIMAVESSADGTEITTTGFHLARDIGHAIHHAFHGRLTFDYGNAETELHVKWTR